jgi:hypothetical protein
MACFSESLPPNEKLLRERLAYTADCCTVGVPLAYTHAPSTFTYRILVVTFTLAAIFVRPRIFMCRNHNTLLSYNTGVDDKSSEKEMLERQ